MKKINKQYNPYKVANLPFQKEEDGDYSYMYINQEDFIKYSEEDEFEIGQDYEKEPNRKIVCKICHSDKWIVGKGNYHTSIKCINCKYEICIHDG